MNERLDGLMMYLNALTKLSSLNYRCHTEVAECVAEIRRELGVGNDSKILPQGTCRMSDDGTWVQFDLFGVPTAQLTDELAKREGVREHRIGAHGDLARIHIDKVTDGYVENIEGPARIIVNKD